MPQPLRQDLSKANAAAGTITGRGGRTQQLGNAAMKRLGAQQPQIRDTGIKAVLGGNPDAAQQGRDFMARLPQPGGGLQFAPKPKQIPGPTDMGVARPLPFGGGGMASYLKGMAPGGPPGGAMPGGMPGALESAMDARGAADGMMPDQAQLAGELGGVDSNAFAANGGTPSGAPLQPPTAAPGGGQAARIAALIARLKGGGMPQPAMA